MYFVNTTGSRPRCGVHNLGLAAYEAIKSLGVTYTDTLDGLPRNSLYIFNYHPGTNLGALNRQWLTDLGGKSIGFLHDPYNNPDFFDIKARLDPTFEDSHPFYGLPRIIKDYTFPEVDRSRIIVSSWGYGLFHKNFGETINLVEAQLKNALIRLHIPFSDWCDSNGVQAKAIAKQCEALCKNNEINISHDYMDTYEFLKWANLSTLNIFSCDTNIVAGISSCIDMALMAKRPIGVNKSMLYRGIYSNKTSLEENSLMDLMKNSSYLDKYRKVWTEEAFKEKIKYLIDKI
mgnify:CR=1 FL=1